MAAFSRIPFGQPQISLRVNNRHPTSISSARFGSERLHSLALRRLKLRPGGDHALHKTRREIAAPVGGFRDFWNLTA